MKVLAIAVLLAASSLQPFPSPASAQSVLLQVTESESGKPITGAFVSLLDQHGGVLRSALTNDTGRFLFPVPAPGTFQVKAEMIGRETQFSSHFTLRVGESGRITLSLPVYAISLEGIRVEADERCRLHPDEASEISRVWEEARKALTVQAWTEREGLYRFQISSYERDLDNRARKVEREHRRETSAVTRTPIGSLPVEDLMAEGFVRPLKGGGHQYHGPDAAVLLSDLFLDTHCLRLTRSQDNPGSIGLSFEPVRDGELPDIDGTLWLDEETADLRFLEYGYTWAPHEEAEGIAGGRVEFEGMPNGAWIVDRWWIRVPILAQDRNMIRLGYSGIWVAGIRETGGEVTQVSTLTQQSISEVDRGSFTGVVWDSTGFGALTGATVFLSGTEYSALTGSEGRFLIEGLPEGVFSASFTHPRLDTLGISAQEREVAITPGEVSELRLSTPSPATILLSACRDEEREAGASVLTGLVRDRASGEPIPAASVRFEWQEILRTIPTVRALNQWFEVSTDGEGRYTACGVPLGEAIVVQATFLEMESDTIHLRFLEEDYRVVDFDLDLPPGLLSARTEALTLREGVGVQGVQGVLLDPESGDPVRSAEVTLRQSPGSVVLTGVTNARGFFRLQTPVPGRYLLSAQALGYSEIRDEVVEISMGKLTVLEIELAPEALELEPLVVVAESRAFHLEMRGFYERQTKGLDTGIFMSPDFIEERQPHKLTDLFFGLPGTRVVESLDLGRGVYFRSGERFGRNPCWPMVFLDRHLISTGGFLEPAALDDFIPAFDVSAVEVYRSPAEIPPEFNGPNAGCGVIVIWTRRGGGL